MPIRKYLIHVLARNYQGGFLGKIAIKIKHLLAKIFGRCADILTFNSECLGVYLIKKYGCQTQAFFLYFSAF